MKGWLAQGIFIFGSAYFSLAILQLLLKRNERLFSGSLTGIVLSTLDMLLMHFLWHIPYTWAALLLGFFSYSSLFLVFKIERMDYNIRILMILSVATMITHVENIVVGGLGTGKILYPVPYWSYTATLIYFLALISLGMFLYLSILKRLTKDQSLKILEL